MAERKLENLTVPKMKTRKAMKARFKVTGRGKLKRTRPGRRHILTKKSSKRKRSLGKSRLVDDGQVKMYKMMIGA
jgi:large subunit ribosomal protein L35